MSSTWNLQRLVVFQNLNLSQNHVEDWTAFNACMCCDVADEGLHVCQLFNKVCVYNRKKYIYCSYLKVPMRGNESDEQLCSDCWIRTITILPRHDKVANQMSRSDWFFCVTFVTLAYLTHQSKFSRLNSSSRIAFKIYIICARCIFVKKNTVAWDQAQPYPPPQTTAGLTLLADTFSYLTPFLPFPPLWSLVPG